MYNIGGPDIYRYVFQDLDEALKIQHLKRVPPRQESLLFTRKKTSFMKEADLKDMFNRAFKSVLPQLFWYILTLLTL